MCVFSNYLCSTNPTEQKLLCQALKAVSSQPLVFQTQPRPFPGGPRERLTHEGLQASQKDSLSFFCVKSVCYNSMTGCFSAIVEFY